MSALTKHQRQTLAILARKAWITAEDGRPAGTDFDTWRHTHITEACGKVGLRCCDQHDFNPIRAHLLHLLGHEEQAHEAELAAQTEPRRQAEAVLVQTCQKWKLELTYAETICQRQYRCGLFDANEKQLWSLIYTINNRGRSRARASLAPSRGEGQGEGCPNSAIRIPQSALQNPINLN
jgi:hypothetical protein